MRDPLSALAAIGRHRLAHLPTPLEELPRLTAALKGPRLLVKRDDCTGLGLGGNKTRQLEFLLVDALARRAATLLPTVGAHSTHVDRQRVGTGWGCFVRENLGSCP